jgi:nickel/cobalt exporter
MRINLKKSRRSFLIFASPALLLLLTGVATAHPLGNFTINHFSRIEVKRDRVHIRYVIDMAEISTLQELQAASLGDVNAPSAEELNSYLAQVATHYPSGLLLTVDGARVELQCISKNLSMPDGAGGLKTLRTELDYEGFLPGGSGVQPHSLAFEDLNHDKRIGWREMVAIADPGLSIFNSSAYGSAVTDELKAYPQDAVAAPLNERTAELSFVAGPAPAGTKSLQARDGGKIIQTRDRLAELIAAPRITPLAALLGLLIAAALGGLHAMSPGHGKTVVGAYLVGSRGNARHAAFLGLTVTITHTAGVFALGIVTLVASRYILPERLFPILSFVSGAMVASIGLSLFVRRSKLVLAARRQSATHFDAHQHAHIEDGMAENQGRLDQGLDHSHGRDANHEHGNHHHHGVNDAQAHSHAGQLVHSHDHDTGHEHSHHHHHGMDEAHSHSHSDGLSGHSLSHSTGQVHDIAREHHHHDGEQEAHVHSHGGVAHSHLPPGADGSPIGWRSLLALGISGGLLPCPSALVVLLAAISLHRVGYGIILVVAFSAGLAGALTSVGLVFVYAGRLVKAKSAGRMATLGRVVPVFSSLVITLAGTAICVEALGQAGVHIGSIISTALSSGLSQTLSMAGFGFLAVLGAVLVGGAYAFKSHHRRRHGW